MAKFICAYTGEEFDASERSIEHIIPDSIGGSDAFIIQCVSKSANHKINQEIDEKFAKSEIISFLCASLGVQARRNERRFKTNTATLGDTGQNISLSLGANGFEVSFRDRKREYTTDDGQNIVEFRCAPGEEEKVIEQFLKRNPNSEVNSTDFVEIKNPSLLVKFDSNIDELVFRKQLIKIAYGYSIFKLGEGFIESESGKLLRKALWANSLQEIEGLSIPWNYFPPPPDKTYELFRQDGCHSVALFNLGSSLACFINLFGSEQEGSITSLILEVCKKPELIKNCPETVAIIDPATKELTEYPLLQWLQLKTQQEHSA